MRSWFKRRGKRPPRRLPQRTLAPVDDIVEQGLLVADVAVRMSVKNEIIMNALKRHVDYHEHEIVDMVRDGLNELAEERERDAAHIARMRTEIRRTGRSSWSDSEYGNDDNRTLRHRQEVYQGVAAHLRERAADETYLRSTAERARTAAWGEIGDSLQERATHPYYSGGASPEYQAARQDRIDAFIARDLAELMQRTRDGAGSAGGAKRRRARGESAGASGR